MIESTLRKQMNLRRRLKSVKVAKVSRKVYPFAPCQSLAMKRKIAWKKKVNLIRNLTKKLKNIKNN